MHRLAKRVVAGNAPMWVKKQDSPDVAREDALQPIQFLLQYWPSRSSKVDIFFISSEKAYVTSYL